jgi:indolepyruvate ferredoxin oxidoreductase
MWTNCSEHTARRRLTSPQPIGSYSLDDRYVRTAGTVPLTGVQALVRAFRDRAILDRARGCHTATFVAGSEGSPLAGLDLEIARQWGALDGFDIVHRPLSTRNWPRRR